MMRQHGTDAWHSLGLGLFCCLIVMAISLDHVASGDESAGTDDDVVDCGTMALGALLSLEGHPTEPNVLLAHLRPSSPAGPSLEELRDAAGRCGLTLRGVVLEKDERAIDRPMIVYLKRPQGGHFQVARPVGHTRRLAQVIDPSLPPAVLDKADLFATPEWTGIALIPDRRPGWPIRIAWGLIGGTAMAGLVTIVPRLRRRWPWLREWRRVNAMRTAISQD